jgi:outer membrane murein-binding lipoprotein Lpp
MKAIVGSILAAAILATIPLAAQAPDTEDQQLLKLVNELTAKQAQLADAEGKIETKVTELAESIRVARLMMSRAGGPHLPPKPGTNEPAQRPPPPPPK